MSKEMIEQQIEKNSQLTKLLKRSTKRKKCQVNFCGANCSRYVDEDPTYCNSHKYIGDFTEEQIELIKLLDTRVKKCSKCTKWHFSEIGTRCDKCKENDKKDNAKAAAKKIEKRCIMFDRNGEPCTSPKKDDKDFCKFHMYCNEYTPEELAQVKQCSGCLMPKYCGINSQTKKEYDTCVKCRGMGEANRESEKAETANKSFCSAITLSTNKQCTKKALSGDILCTTHKNIEKLKQNAINTNQKLCSKLHHSKNCLELLSQNDPFSTCLECRKQNKK